MSYGSSQVVDNIPAGNEIIITGTWDGTINKDNVVTVKGGVTTNIVLSHVIIVGAVMLIRVK